MTDPSLSVLSATLQPLVASVFRFVPRLHAERQAGQIPFTQSSSIMDGLLNETLDRIRGGNIDSGWWRSLLDRFGQRYVAPDFLTKPAIREWLGDESVANDLKTIATSRIVASDQDENTSRNRLTQSYCTRTGEASHLATGPIDTVIAILVAGYVNAVPADQKAIAGMIQAVLSHTVASYQRLEQPVSPLADPMTRQAHTDHAIKELTRIVALRAFDPARSRTNIQELQRRLETGNLVAADDDVKQDVRYWLARLCAGDAETLHVAERMAITDHQERFE